MRKAVATTLIALVVLAGCATAQAPASPTPGGQLIQQYKGVCGFSQTPMVDVPDGSVVHWEVHPTEFNSHLTVDAMFSSGSFGTIIRTNSNDDTSGNVQLSNSDGVQFLAVGSGCTYTLSLYTSP